MRRNAAKCGAFLAHFGSIRAILGCFEMRRNAAADPNAAHFGAFRRHARRIMQLSRRLLYPPPLGRVVHHKKTLKGTTSSK